MIPRPTQNCPCCAQVMRYNEWDKIHVCRCQGTLMELAELQAIASQGSKVSVNQAQAPQVATDAYNNVNPHYSSPQPIGSASQLPTTEFYAVTIAPNASLDKTFLNNNSYYFDMQNRVWFKKVRAVNYNFEKSLLDRAKITHEVLPA